MTHTVVSRDEWLQSRKDFLAKEKEFTRLRDELSQARRGLPWVKVDKNYIFEGKNGKESLSDLFEGRSQLVVYHFMYHPDWEEGCKSCSFWADNFNDIIIHLNHRDVTMVTVSRAPLDKLESYKQRMGWSFKWLSSFENDFNYDFAVSFRDDDANATYNYQPANWGSGAEAPGVSVFYKDEVGDIFHTYSAYARGLDMMNTAYHYLDLVPKGRDESDGVMRWLRRHDDYSDSQTA